MKGLLIRLIRLLVRRFYRRIDTTGSAHVPAHGPLLLVANHFNSLVDPMLILATIPRPVVFVAKSTLWKMPGLKTLLNILGVVPVRRRVDTEEAASAAAGIDRNQESFDRLAAVLRGGGAVLIFPEGRSHSEPSLSKIRTGAARILLQAGTNVTVLPVGLWFTKKEEFQSDVLVRVGEPVQPTAESVEAWTEAIEAGLRDVTLNAASWEEHEAVRAVESVYGGSLSDEPATLDRSFRNRRVLLDARKALERKEPGAVARLARRSRAFERLCHRVGLTPDRVDDLPGTPRLAFAALRSALFTMLGFPFAGLGILAFYVPYRLCGVLANRIVPARDDVDELALYKILVGAVLFPLALIVETGLCFYFFGGRVAIVAALVLPVSGLFTLWYAGAWEKDQRGFRALAMELFSGAGDGMAFLRTERDALRAECDRLAAVFRMSESARVDNQRP
ncbi:MAG: 1-acyl-sn-glycerol-3-phosphate acyltransferase [Thermoanaerobaculia bacterium]